MPDVSSNGHVVVVDDDRLVTQLLKKSLEEESYQVTTFETAGAACDAIPWIRPHLVITDLRLGRESGLQIITHMRSLEGTREIPIILLTGAETPPGANKKDPIVEALRLGATDFLAKPVPTELLIAKVRLLVQHRQTQRQRIDFVAMIMHDLNSPLASVHGFSQLLGNGHLGPPGSPRAMDAIEAIRRNSSRMLQLVREFTKLAKIEAGQYIPKIERLPLAEMLVAVIERVGPLANESQVKIVLDISPKANQTFGDAIELDRAFENIVTNGIKYNKPGGLLQIRTEALPDGHYLNIHFKDSGVGLSPEELPHLFERFHRAEGTASKREGTGLGLSILKSVIESHCGSIGVESELGKGTTFTVRLLCAVDIPKGQTPTSFRNVSTDTGIARRAG